MLLNWIYMFLCGFVHISVEGFFIERFINICINQKIIMQDLHRENNAYIRCKILKSDFKNIRHIAKKTKCKVRIEKKSGVPFFINKYRKRKVFAVAIVVIAIFVFILTKFIWNIEINGNEKISNEDILNMVKEYGIEVGKLKNKIDTEKASNLIRLNRDDLSWIGITIKGTNVVIVVQESTKKPEIIDKNEVCNVIAKKDAIISKIIVQNGTERVKVGDKVTVGTLLVEGIMQGVHTGDRYVHAEATIFGKNVYEKEKKESFVQNVTVKTGNKEEKSKICINNFKINFNKGVSKFKNYDTICASKKIKLFSNLYLPIEIEKTTNIEIANEQKNYSEEELRNKLISEIEEEFENEYRISEYDEKNKRRDEIIEKTAEEMTVKIIYELQEEIGTKAK